MIRTDFDNQQEWDTICGLIRAPVHDGDNTFYAYVDFVENVQCRNGSVADLLQALPHDYKHSFLFVVDGEALSRAGFPLLVVDLIESREVALSEQFLPKFRASRITSQLPTWVSRNLRMQSIRTAFFAASGELN